MEPPRKSLADYLMVAVSPVLIMVLVGSLVFFLIQVFFRGAVVQGMRWVLFWFVLAIVLVSRVGIEQGKNHALFYGGALAGTMWLYLNYTHNVPLVGAILLGITWWCAHRLTVDCTLISEEEDASGEGVLQGMWRTLEKSVISQEPAPKPPPLSPLDALVMADLAKRRARKQARPPGRSVVYFSLAALPLFGLGQLFLPADDPQSRRAGFAFLAAYLGAALCLLVTTSFLGLRRYLRQRSVEMSASITLGWVQFGVLLAGGVLLLSTILPRPGANVTWKEFAARAQPNERRASDYALPFNPPAQGAGTPSDQPTQREQPGLDSRNAPSGGGAQNSRNARSNPSNPRTPSDSPAKSDGGGDGAGGEGSSGQGAPDQNGTQSKRTIHVKDVVPSSGADPGTGRDQPAGPDDGGEPKADGAGGRVVVDPSSHPNHAANGSSKSAAQAPQPSQPQPEPEPSGDQHSVPTPPSEVFHRLLRALLIGALAALFLWFGFRYRKQFVEMLHSFLAAVAEFVRKLLSFRLRRPASAEPPPAAAVALEPFSAYDNPFLNGQAQVWPPERLLFYTYAAIQAWAKEQGIQIRPEQTAREFCSELILRFSDCGEELAQLSRDYTHAAFGQGLPEGFELGSLRQLWQYLGDTVLTVASH